MKNLESDWKMYNELVPLLRDRFFLRKNEELVSILSQLNKTPTEVFWETKSQIDQQAEIIDQCFGNHSRSKMWMSILMMRRHGLIGDQELEPFSDSLKQDVLKCSKVAKISA